MLIDNDAKHDSKCSCCASEPQQGCVLLEENKYDQQTCDPQAPAVAAAACWMEGGTEPPWKGGGGPGVPGDPALSGEGCELWTGALKGVGA